MGEIWFTLSHVWISPQQTVRKVADHPKSKTPVFLAVLDGTRLVLDLAFAYEVINYFASYTEYVLTIAILGPLVGVAILDFESFLLYLIGHLLGTKGTFTRVRAAVAISSIPRLAGALCSTLLPGFTAFFSLFFLLWSAILLTRGLAWSFRVSAWRALKIVILALHPVLLVIISYLMSGPALAGKLTFFIPILIGAIGLLFLSGVAVSNTFRGGRFPRWATRWANRRLFTGQVADFSADDPVYFAKARWVLFPVALSFSFLSCLFLALFIAPNILRFPELTNLLSWGLYGMGATFLGISGFYHLQVNQLRHIKYELTMCGIVLLSQNFMTSDALAAVTAGADIFARPADLMEILVGFYLFPVGWLFITGLPLALFFWRKVDNRPPSKTIAFLYRHTRTSISITMGAVGLIAFTDDLRIFLLLALILLMVRYSVYERMLVNPIVFLRSFHSQESTVALGRVITATAGRHAPIVALTHSLQPPETLLAEMQPDHTARLYTSSNSNWRQWVTQHLECCRAVILDATLTTQGLQWELQQAYTLVDHDRIAVLAVQGTNLVHPRDIQHFYYRLDWAGKRNLRRQLNHWLINMQKGSGRKRRDKPA